MKTNHTRRNWVLLSLATGIGLCACRDGSNKGPGSMSQDNKSYVGSWQAEGPLLMGGYQHGKYAIHMDLSENGSCRMDVRIDTNKTALSEIGTKLINLEGQWSVQGGKVHTEMKVNKWTVKGPSNYQKEEPFENFSTTYVFRVMDGVLVHGEDFKDNMRLASTEDAGMTMSSKGVDIHLTCPQFNKLP